MIGAGLGLVGSLIGGKEKKQEVVNRVDYKRMVRDAEAAGFNPLTALRNGGAAGFSVTTQPVLSSTHSAVGQALGGIGNFIANFDPFEDKMREAQYGVMQAQLQNLQADTALKGRQYMFDVPAATARTKVSAGPVLGSLAAGPAPEPGDRTVTNPWTDHEVNPYYLDAEAFEARYGDSEIAQMIYGGRNMYADYLWNIQREIERARPAYLDKQKANLHRKARIRKSAGDNARDLGFPAGW